MKKRAKNAVPDAIDLAKVEIEGAMPQREEGYTLKDGWFTVKEYCEEIRKRHSIVRMPANVTRDLHKKINEGAFEGAEVRGWDITGKRRVPLNVYRKKETPDAKPVDRLRRPVL